MKSTRFATLCVALGLASFFNFGAQAQITVDGTKEAAYGSPLSTQTLTGWGANNSLASLSAVQQGGSLFVFVAGRPQGNAFILFIDSKPGGVQFSSNRIEYYTRASNTWTDTGITYAANGQCLHITFQRLTSTTATGIVQLLPSGPGSAISVSLGTSDGNLAIDQLEFYCGGTDAPPNPANENNFYFNFLSAFNAWR